jgi:hypothetical protein
MKTYVITEKIDTWASIEVEADSPEDALKIINDPQFEGEWSYSTDYDFSTVDSVKEKQDEMP